MRHCNFTTPDTFKTKAVLVVSPFKTMSKHSHLDLFELPSLDYLLLVRYSICCYLSFYSHSVASSDSRSPPSWAAPTCPTPPLRLLRSRGQYHMWSPNARRTTPWLKLADGRSISTLALVHKETNGQSLFNRRRAA